MLAEQVLGGAHPDDRLMLAAGRAMRDELVAAQAVDAAPASGKLGRPQPRLAAPGANRALERRRLPFLGHPVSPPPARVLDVEAER